MDKLVGMGHDVHVIDDQSAELNDPVYNDYAAYYKVDIGDSLRVIEDVFRGTDFVFHLAAESRIQPAIKNPHKAHTTNAIGTLNLLEMCKKHGVKKLIYSSTSSVYESLSDELGATDENTKIICLNPYALSKLFGEDLCRYYSNVHGLETVVFRYFNVFGERSPNKGTYAPVVGIFLDQLRRNVPLTIVGDGEQRRDFVHVSDVVAANVSAMVLNELTHGLPFNIGTGRNISINEIAAVVRKERPNTSIQYVDAREGEVRHTRASIERAKHILGFNPAIMVEDWIPTQFTSHARSTFR